MFSKFRFATLICVFFGITPIAVAEGIAENLAQPTRRIALVVGIGDYEKAPDLVNPIRDARAVAAEFWRSGFEVIEILDPNVELLRASLKVMGERMDTGSHAAFYFAGHGVQISERNYLLAKDVNLSNGENDALKSAVSASEIASALTNSGASLAILILDACRNNPFSTLSASVGRGVALDAPVGERAVGLAEINVDDAANEFLMAFATSPGAVAFDGPERGNSPFTTALINTIQKPELDVRDVFSEVRDKVSRATEGQQIPWVYSALESGFVFRDDVFSADRGAANLVDTLGALPPTLVLEKSLWRAAVRGGRREQFELYLEEFPDGNFAHHASAWLSGTAISQQSVLARAENLPPHLTVAAGVRTHLSALFSAEDLENVSYLSLTAPANGIKFVTKGGQALPESAEVPASNFQGIAIETAPTIAGRQGVVSLLDAKGSLLEEREIVVEYDTCDMVAGYPHDPNRVGRGARLELMKPRLAIEACRAAVTTYPNSARLKAVLGRAYRSAGDFDAARFWNGLALEEEYSTASVALGKMSLLGQGGPKDLEASVKYFRQGAELGDSWGLNALGQAYLLGTGVPVDTKRGIALIRQSADAGNDWAHTLMGRVYENGWGVAPSPETAVEWYLKAAQMGDPSAKLELSDAYRKEQGVERDLDEALRWIESAAGQGWSFAQARLGREYEIGEIVPRDLQAAISWYEVAAAQGDPEGEYLLGKALLSGEGQSENSELAVALLRLSAAKNNVQAAYLLGELHERGQGVATDLPFALAMYQQAWDLGYAPAARRLASAHAKGFGGTIDGSAAVSVLRALIDETDNEWAIRDLAALLKQGKVVPQDAEASAKLTLRAVTMGNSYAFRDHAVNLETGFGTARDSAEAFKFMRQAAETENPWARLDLARYYGDGIGTAADKVISGVWLARASALDDSKSAQIASERAKALGSNTLLVSYGQLAGLDRPLSAEEAKARLLAGGIDPSNAAEIFVAMTDLARNER